MSHKRSLVIIAALLFILLSCKKNPSVTPNNVDIYVAGYTTGSPTSLVATYWKNGTPNYLTSTSVYSTADAITVQGNDVYAAGYSSGQAAYWKNGIVTALSNGPGGGSHATGIAVLNNDVYVVGYTNYAAVCWKNGVLIPLGNTDHGLSAANAIMIHGNDVYIAGNSTDPITNVQSATYWKNGVAVILENQTYSNAQGIAVTDQNDVYVSGVIVNNQNETATYWKNGNATTLADKSNANSIYVHGSDVYILGNGPNGIVCWKNGTGIINIPDLTTSFGYGITVNGGNTYIAGKFNNDAVFWKNNGSAVVLNNTFTSGAKAIFVGQH